MRISPRILYSLLPLFMRAPMKMKILIGIVAVIGFFAWKTMGSSLGQGGQQRQSQPAQYQQGNQGGSNLPVDDLSIGEALGN